MRPHLVVAACAPLFLATISNPRKAHADTSAMPLGAGNVEFGVGAAMGSSDATNSYSQAVTAGAGISNTIDVGLRIANVQSMDEHADFIGLMPTLWAKFQLARWASGTAALALAPEASWLHYSATLNGWCAYLPEPGACQLRKEIRTLRLELPLAFAIEPSPRIRIYLKARLIGDLVDPLRETLGGADDIYTRTTAVLLGVTAGWHIPVSESVAFVPELRAVLFRRQLSGEEMGSGLHGFNRLEASATFMFATN